MKIVLICLIILTVAFTLTTLINSHWTVDGSNPTGLWQICSSGCKFNSVSDAHINSIRALSILNVILALLALYWVFHDGIWHLRIYLIAIFAIGITNMSLYSKWKKTQSTLQESKLSIDYYLQIGVIITSIIAAGLTFRKED